MYNMNRDRDREEYESWHRYGRERGWFGKLKDEVSSWFGDDEADHRRRIEREEHERMRHEMPENRDYLQNDRMRRENLRDDWRDNEPRSFFRRDNEMFGRGYNSPPSSRYEDNEPRSLTGNWGGTAGRESEFTGPGGSSLSPWTNRLQNSSLRQQRGRRGPKNFKRNDDRISDDIHDKIDRHLDIDAREVIIEVKDGDVTLRGTVFERADKRLIEEIVEDVFGVKNVQNMLRVNREDGIPGESSVGTGSLGNSSSKIAGKQ